MPAPSSMFAGQPLPLSSSPNSRRDASGIHQGLFNGNGYEGDNVTSSGNTTHRASSNSSGATVTVASSSVARMYDEIFVSKPVSEVKTMLWEIKDFSTVFSDRVERAMNFEFEVGRLGSMERHLPRRSRWKMMLDVEEVGSLRIPAIRVLQLSPENKTIFFQLNVCILERKDTAGVNSDVETEFQTSSYGYKEGQNSTDSFENVFPFQFNASCGNDGLEQIKNYIYEGSLFLKITIEVLEDAST